MKNRSAVHSIFTIERSYPVTPARVFAAWSSQEAKARWFVGPDEWKKSDHVLDFRVGGKEHLSGGPKGGTVHRFDATYQDIIPNERIIYSYDMHLDDAKISVSLATIEFKAEGTGTKMILTEQGVFIDGYDDSSSREKGTIQLLEQLGASLLKG
jgi:uncharacterized protein YndB with AHSA1/START domain